jgi:hypothetical protein
MKVQRRPRLLGLLVVAQVALSFVLLISAGLVGRSLTRFDRLGSLDPSTVATLRLRPRLVGYGPQEGQAFTREVVRRLSGLPGVSSVSVSAGLPPLPFFNPVAVGLPGEGPSGTGRGLEAWSDEIGPDLFETLGIGLLRGRDFDGRDAVGRAPVVIVNRALAAALWPDGGAIGEAIGRSLMVDGRNAQVVGVVEDAAYLDATQASLFQVYAPYWQDPSQVDARVSVRATGDAAALLPMLRREVQAIDPVVPVTESESMASRLEREFAPVYLAGRVLATAGGLALFSSPAGPARSASASPWGAAAATSSAWCCATRCGWRAWRSGWGWRWRCPGPGRWRATSTESAPTTRSPSPPRWRCWPRPRPSPAAGRRGGRAGWTRWWCCETCSSKGW